MKRSLLVILSILWLMPVSLPAQTLSKTDILKQMKQFNFSDTVTAKAVTNGISLKTILTLRKLQESNFDDSVYLAVIDRHGEFTNDQIIELKDLKASGFSDALIIAALPENSGNINPAVSNAPMKSGSIMQSMGNGKQAKQGSSSLLFPDESHNVALTIMGSLNTPALEVGSEMTSSGGGFRYSAITQKSETKGFGGAINMFVYSLSSDVFESNTVVMQNYFSWMHFFNNGIKKDIAGEIVHRGLTLTAGPLVGWGITSIDNTTDIGSISSGFYNHTFSLGTLWSGLVGVRGYAEVPIIPGKLYGTALGDLFSSFIFGTIETKSRSYYSGYSSSSESSIDIEETYFTPGYSFDLVFYPSQALPQLKMTLGTMIQVFSDDDSMTMYTFGITWSKGPLYKSRSAGINVR